MKLFTASLALAGSFGFVIPVQKKVVFKKDFVFKTVQLKQNSYIKNRNVRKKITTVVTVPPTFEFDPDYLISMLPN